MQIKPLNKLYQFILFSFLSTSSFATDSTFVSAASSTPGIQSGRALAMGVVNADYSHNGPAYATSVNTTMCAPGEQPCATLSLAYASQTGNSLCMIRWIDNYWGTWGNGSCWFQLGTLWILYIFGGEYYGGGCYDQNIGISYVVNCIPQIMCPYGTNTSCY